MKRSVPLLRFGFWVAAAFWLVVAPLAQTSQVMIGSISFDGNKIIPARQLKGLLLNSTEGSIYSPGNLKSDLQRVEKVYQDEGYLNVRVGPPEVQYRLAGNAKIAEIRVPISEGPVYLTGNLGITNVRAFGTETLIQMCPLRKGQPYSRNRVSQWQSKIEEAYHSLGYLRFGSVPRETVNEGARTVDMILECVEGKQYSVGKISVVGDTSIDALDFKRHLLISEGGLFNPEMFGASIQYLNQMQRYRPISQSDVQITIDDDKGTVDLAWRLTKIR